MSCAMPRPGREGSLPACSRTTSSLPRTVARRPANDSSADSFAGRQSASCPRGNRGALSLEALLGVARRQDTGALPSLKINASALDDLARVISLQNILPDDQSDGLALYELAFEAVWTSPWALASRPAR